MPMRRLFVLALLLFVAAPAAAQGSIAFAETDHTFEGLREGEVARHVFAFRNAGDAPLRLTAVRPSCGCTTGDWPREPLAPGDTASIAVSYDAEGRPGAFERDVLVLTDGDPEYVTLYIRGDVMPRTLTSGTRQGHLRIARELLFNQTIPAGGSERFVFRIQNDGAQPLRILSAETGAGVVVSLPAAPLLPGEPVELPVVVSAADRAPGAAFDHAIVLVTDDADGPRKTLRVRGTVAPR